MTTNKDIFRLMESWAPSHLAYNWDKVGLQVGSKQNKVKKIMVTLDVLESVVDEAIENHVDLIIAHHPLLFQPLQELDIHSTKGRIIEKLIRHHITVYASHTNLDVAAGGVNDMLSNKLGLKNCKSLIKAHSESLYKIVVFVPCSHKDEVRNALGLAGAGHIGNYSHCTFQTEGQGTFKPLSGANPFIGNENELEVVDEVKIETIVREKQLNKVINQMVQAHPYEEVAYDIYPLHNKGDSFGLGKIGTLDEETTLEAFITFVKSRFQLPHVRVSGKLTAKVKKVAVLGGSGEKYWQSALKSGADVYITGDMTFHHAQDAWQAGLNVIDAGHYIEKIMKQYTKAYLDEHVNEDIEVLVSTTNTDPFQYV